MANQKWLNRQYLLFCTIVDVNYFSKVQIFISLAMFGMYIFGTFDKVWFTKFSRRYGESNFNFSIIPFEVMNLIILKDITSWKKIKSDMLKTNKHTKYQQIDQNIHFWSIFKIQNCAKKIYLVCTILDVDYFSKFQILTYTSILFFF